MESIDYRLIDMVNQYEDFSYSYSLKQIPEREYLEKLEQLEQQSIAIWGSTAKFYNLLKQKSKRYEQLSKQTTTPL
jgi:hypothetical protein